MYWSSFVLVVLGFVVLHGGPAYGNGKDISYKQNGDFIIGGILPLSKACGSSDYNIKGIAIAHSIYYALKKMDAMPADDDDRNAGLKNKYKHLNIGFEIYDACAAGEVERKVAYKFAQAVYSKQKKGPNVVLSSFSEQSIKSIKLLSIEEIPMMSYVIDNARLTQSYAVSDEDIKLLASAYPEQTSKMLVVADLIKKFKFNHVHIIASSDAHGKKGVEVLSSKMTTAKAVHTLFISGRADVRAVVEKIAENQLIRTVVLHLSGGLDADVFAEAMRQNLTENLFISTHDWKEKGNQLKEYAKEVEGMLFVNMAASRVVRPKTRHSIYKEHISNIKRPFTEEKWLEDYYISLGANKNPNGCYNTLSNQTAQVCKEAEDEMKRLLKSENDISVVIIDAVYAIAEALKKNKDFLKALPSVDFTSPQTENKIKYSKSLELESTAFDVYTVGADGQPALVGKWVKGENPELVMEKVVKFKNGSSEVPISACSQPCLQGEHRTYPEGEGTGCWVCEPCLNGSVSNVTNSRDCYNCQFGRTANPNQTICVDYKVEHFTWYDPIGQFLIFLMVVGVVFALFSLGILSQNSSNTVVKIGGYQLCGVYLFGCMLCFLAPIPLLLMPSVTTCSTFISVFGVALSIPLAALISKTAIISERYFDENNQLIKTSLGKRPRALVIVVCVVIQIAIVVVGAYIAPPQVLHRDTEKWDVKYAECAHYLSFPFWISFGYNIALGVLVNALSCNAEKIEERFGELRNLICTSLFFYLMCLINIALIYRETNEGLAAAQSVMCFMFGLVFVIGFMLPKVYTILYRTKSDGTVEEEQLLADGKATPTKITASRHSDGYKHHGIIQMRINEGSDEEGETERETMA